MTVEQMRDRIKTVYTGKTWAEKVNEMSKEQIIALYYSLVKRGQIK